MMYNLKAIANCLPHSHSYLPAANLAHLMQPIASIMQMADYYNNVQFQTKLLFSDYVVKLKFRLNL